MRKLAVVLALFMMAVASARADDVYNGIDFGYYFDNSGELPCPLDWAGWEMLCYKNGKEPDFNEYNITGSWKTTADVVWNVWKRI